MVRPLKADVNATLGQQVLDLPHRQRELNIHHHSEPDDLGRTVEPLLRRWSAL